MFYICSIKSLIKFNYEEFFNYCIDVPRHNDRDSI